MGYRSDVVMAIEFEERGQLVGFVAFMRMNTMPMLQDVLDDMVIIPDTNIIALIQEGIKWYENYEYVHAAERIYSLAKERDASVMRMVIGEEYQDCQYDAHCLEFSTLDQHFDIVRYIKFPNNTAPMLKTLTTTVTTTVE